MKFLEIAKMLSTKHEGICKTGVPVKNIEQYVKV